MSHSSLFDQWPLQSHTVVILVFFFVTYSNDMLEVNSNVSRNNKLKLMKIAENTVKGYHMPRYIKQMPQAQDKLFENKRRNVLLAQKHANAMKRVAGIPHNNMTNENVLGRMIPTAMRIKTNTENNYAALHPLLKKNAKKNRDPNFLKNSNKYNHIHVTKNNKTGNYFWKN